MANKKELIYELIPKIAGEVGAVKKELKVKTGHNQGYVARGIEGIYNAVSPIMAKHGVFSTASILSEERKEVVTKSGTKGVHCIIKYLFTFYATDGSSVQQEAIGEGIDYGDKVANKCFSVGHKYALVGLFALPFDEMDDPDKVGVHEIAQTQNKKVNTKPPANQSGDRKVTAKELKVLGEVITDLHLERGLVKDFCETIYGVDNSKNLTQKQYLDLMKALQDNPPDDLKMIIATCEKPAALNNHAPQSAVY